MILLGDKVMYKKKGDFVKLTIRVDTNEHENLKKICEIFGISANNQINMMIREFNFKNRNLIDEIIPNNPK